MRILKNVMHSIKAFLWGGVIAVFGGLIGLGGAEFRLPVLVEVFRFPILQAVVINLMLSLVTVTFSFIFRSGLGNWEQIVANAGIILDLLVCC